MRRDHRLAAVRYLLLRVDGHTFGIVQQIIFDNNVSIGLGFFGSHFRRVEYSLRIGELVFFGVFVNILVKTGLVYNGYLSDFIAR